MRLAPSRHGLTWRWPPFPTPAASTFGENDVRNPWQPDRPDRRAHEHRRVRRVDRRLRGDRHLELSWRILRMSCPPGSLAPQRLPTGRGHSPRRRSAAPARMRVRPPRGRTRRRRRRTPPTRSRTQSGTSHPARPSRRPAVAATAGCPGRAAARPARSGRPAPTPILTGPRARRAGRGRGRSAGPRPAPRHWTARRPSHRRGSSERHGESGAPGGQLRELGDGRGLDAGYPGVIDKAGRDADDPLVGERRSGLPRAGMTLVPVGLVHGRPPTTSVCAVRWGWWTKDRCVTRLPRGRNHPREERALATTPQERTTLRGASRSGRR